MKKLTDVVTELSDSEREKIDLRSNFAKQNLGRTPFFPSNLLKRQVVLPAALVKVKDHGWDLRVSENFSDELMNQFPATLPSRSIEYIAPIVIDKTTVEHRRDTGDMPYSLNGTRVITPGGLFDVEIKSWDLELNSIPILGNPDLQIPADFGDSIIRLYKSNLDDQSRIGQRKNMRVIAFDSDDPFDTFFDRNGGIDKFADWYNTQNGIPPLDRSPPLYAMISEHDGGHPVHEPLKMIAWESASYVITFANWSDNGPSSYPAQSREEAIVEIAHRSQGYNGAMLFASGQHQVMIDADTRYDARLHDRFFGDGEEK